jgi:cytochrome c553
MLPVFYQTGDRYETHSPDRRAGRTDFRRRPALADGAKLYQEKTCVACHGKDAKKPLTPAYPKLAGQNAAYAEQQMKDIKSGARANGQARR